MNTTMHHIFFSTQQETCWYESTPCSSDGDPQN